MPINILLYADDLVLLAPSCRAQRRLLNICASVVAELDMTFNAHKSDTLIFVPYNCSRRVTYSFPSFVPDASHLKVVDRFKYLGHIISTVSDENDYILNQMSLFLPEQTCYYVDLVNVTYLSNYVFLNLLYSVVWPCSVAKVQYHCAKETQS